MATDISNKKFGRLLAIKPTEKRSKSGAIIWLCECDCGKECLVEIGSLNSGNTRSCGCMKIEHAVSMGRKNIKYPGYAAFKDIFRNYKLSAKNRKLEFSLTPLQVRKLTKGNCFYCGEPPSKIRLPRGSYTPYIYNGIDRLINSVGYTLENCVSCCWECNKLKKDKDHTEFITKIIKIYHNIGVTFEKTI